jgi:hypothetical protein
MAQRKWVFHEIFIKESANQKSLRPTGAGKVTSSSLRLPVPFVSYASSPRINDIKNHLFQPSERKSFPNK